MEKSKKNETQLKEALKKLIEAADKIQHTQGYNQETGRLRLLTELLREQTQQ